MIRMHDIQDNLLYWAIMIKMKFDSLYGQKYVDTSIQNHGH